jgi:hypothetical protein
MRSIRCQSAGSMVIVVVYGCVAGAVILRACMVAFLSMTPDLLPGTMLVTVRRPIQLPPLAPLKPEMHRLHLLSSWQRSMCMSGSAAPVKEQDLIVPALKAAAAQGGFITTAKLIVELEQQFGPTGHDAQILDGRSDTHFSQKVRNLVSHRDASTSMFTRGLAVYDDALQDIRITTLGQQYLAKLGY